MNIGKKVAGEKAVEFINEGMWIGLGTGTTVFYFIQALAEKVKKGFSVNLIATSKDSYLKGKQLGLSVFYDAYEKELPLINIAIDGADEVDSHNTMIKGGGGAFLREKIIDSSAEKFIIIIDESKCVESVGKFPLPLEIAPFLPFLTEKKILELGFKGSFRKKENNALYLTENNNLIFDLKLPSPLKNPKELDCKLKEIPGVLETGFFFTPIFKKIVGYRDGSCKIF